MDTKVLRKISYGMFVVSSKRDDKFNGQIANTVFQVTSEPPTIAVSINKQNLTHEFIKESRIFTASILAKETPLKFIGQFGFKSGRDIDKFKDVNFKIGTTGIPIVIDSTIAYLEAEVINSINVGTHTIFIGKILDAQTINEGEPMTYAYYHDLKGGQSPSTAPTYIKEEIKNGIGKMQKYKCTVCGYIYDPEKGDSDSGIKPGTLFEQLPDNWVCPVCGADKSAFEKVQ